MNLIFLVFAVALSPFVFCFQPNRVHISRHLTCTPSSSLTSQCRLETTNIDATTSNDNESTTTSSVVRKPWDVLRFISQSSKFVQSPFASFSRKSTMTQSVIKPGEILWTPTSSSSSSSLLRFAPLDDVVMGGASYSTIDDNTGIWCGYVTDANNGGFVGIRTTPIPSSFDMSSCTGIELRVRTTNDARSSGIAASEQPQQRRRYKFITRDTTNFNGICWTTEFDVDAPITSSSSGNSSVMMIRIPFTKQIPTIFAKTVINVSFNANNVVGFQFTYSKFAYDNKYNPHFQFGDFCLQLLELKSY